MQLPPQPAPAGRSATAVPSGTGKQKCNWRPNLQAAPRNCDANPQEAVQLKPQPAIQHRCGQCRWRPRSGRAVRSQTELGNEGGGAGENFATPFRVRAAISWRLATCTGECLPGSTYENRRGLGKEYNNGPSGGLQAVHNSKPLPGNNLTTAKNGTPFLRHNVSCAITTPRWADSISTTTSTSRTCQARFLQLPSRSGLQRAAPVYSRGAKGHGG